MFKLTLNDEVKDVRVSERLTDSAVCLFQMKVIWTCGPNACCATESTPIIFKRILEINPRHALITALAQSVEKRGRRKGEEAARLLLDQARIIEGEQIPDPTAFSRRLNIVMASALPV